MQRNSWQHTNSPNNIVTYNHGFENAENKPFSVVDIISPSNREKMPLLQQLLNPAIEDHGDKTSTGNKLRSDTCKTKRILVSTTKEKSGMCLSTATPGNAINQSPTQSFMQSLLTEHNISSTMLVIDADPSFIKHVVAHNKYRNYDDDIQRKDCNSCTTCIQHHSGNNECNENTNIHNYDDMPPLIDIGREMRSIM